MKVLCIKCKKEKDMSFFNNDSNICMLCIDKRKKKKMTYEEHKIYHMKNYEAFIIRMTRHRAKKSNIPFNITKEDIIIPNYCPILGIPLDRRDRDHSPSLDKVIPSKGYTKENIAIISMKANRLKNNASVDDLEKILKYMKYMSA